GNVIVLGEWQDVGLDSSRAVLIPWSEGKPELPIPLDIKFYDFASLRSKSEFWVIEGNGFSFYKEGSKLLSVRCKDMYFGIRALYPDLSDDNTAYAVEYSDLWKFEEGSCFNLSYNVEILKDIEAHKMFIEVFSRDRLWLLSRGGVLISLEGQNWRRQRITPLAVTLNHLRVFSDQLAWAVGDNGVVIRYANGEWTTVHPRR
ncbi:MAG: hypothetical protein RMM31_06125, partial [Anaerolineae bacterium]|nr:hypothetical protein [Anaerolineae bacterium]